MDIELKFNKDFERALNSLREKYGEDFEILNGIHNSQMNFSDFIDAFVDKNVADVTIDSNANASNKDIASFRSEKGKSIDKVIAANKIFYEIKKKYGLDMGVNYNVSKKENARVPTCPKEKEAYIIDALKHFRLLDMSVEMEA